MLIRHQQFMGAAMLPWNEKVCCYRMYWLGLFLILQRRPGLPKKAAYQPASILGGTHRPEAKYTRPVLRQPISDRSSFIYIQQSPKSGPKSLSPKLASFTSLPARAEMEHPPSPRLEAPHRILLTKSSLVHVIPPY
jgi:hypothetical protein